MKLPVFKAIGTTFAFVLGHFFDIVRITWLPLLALTAATWWFLHGILAFVVGITELGPIPDGRAVLDILLKVGPASGVLFLASLVFYPMLYAGLLRLIMRGEKPAGAFYLEFGGDEFRILGTYLLLILINLGVNVAIGIPQGLLFLTLGGADVAIAVIVNSLIDIAAAALGIWIALRLSLAFAAAISESGIGIGPSWSIAKGNVWNLLGYWLLWIILGAVVSIACIIAFAPGIFEFCRAVMTAAQDDGQMKTVLREHAEMFTAWINNPGQAVLMAVAVLYAVNLIFISFMIAAGGIAYRLMTDGGEGKSHAG
jgi:hypothetical protein